jgi:hypothetical protein
MQVFGVCKSYNYITHLSTYTPTRSQANHRLVDENPIRSHEIPAFFPSNPLPGLHGAHLVPGAIGRVQRRLRRTFGFTFVVLVCMAIIAARRGILAVEMLFSDMGKIRIFFMIFYFFGILLDYGILWRPMGIGPSRMGMLKMLNVVNLK